MKDIKYIIGTVVVIFGILFGFYVGFWLMFIGGIVDIINAIKASGPVSYTSIGFGGLKMIFGSGAGWITAALFYIFGSWIRK